ncbi:MAG TPA: CDP-alcohol phosphatidyltransferase family protein [Gemmatimonadales bacterium]|nr:CDP-alcohol phosphatidyltransferase family protein [Gemmatimonadales bacterium]
MHPLAVTLLGFGAGLVAALAAARQAYGVALVAWLANRVLDGLDGVLARETRRVSDFGGYLDLLLDFLVYALVPLGIVAGRPSLALALAALVLLAAFYVNAASWMYLAAVLERREAGAAARGEQTVVTMPRGLIEGTETMVFYALFLLLPGNVAPLFLVMAALVAVTVAQRVWWAWRGLGTTPPSA